MRELVLTGALACVLCAGVYAEEDAKQKASAPAGRAGQKVVFEEAGPAAPKAPLAVPAPNRQPNDGGVNDSGAMPTYQSHDPVTGLPDYVPSDSYGEVDE